MSPSRSASHIAYAEVDWVANAPRSIFFDDIYFAGSGPEEAQHVFIAGNDLAQRWRSARSFRICELGFGTGLNILETLALWRETPRPPTSRLHIVSTERYPLAPADLERAHHAWPQHASASARLRALYPPPIAGAHLIDLAPDASLTLWFGDAEEVLEKLEGIFDAWFLDGFAPSRNPDLWSAGIFRNMRRLSRAGATFATYSVAGSIRRGLAEAGFEIERRAGFGRKREMLVGRIDAAGPGAAPARAPWFVDRAPLQLEPGARVAIIGGGIAGASLAHAAERAGLAATIFDRTGLAAGASGNAAGLIMPRIDIGATPASRFLLASYVHAVRCLAAFDERVFQRTGALLAARSETERTRQAAAFDARRLPPGWIECRADGLFFPQAGVVDAPALVGALAATAQLRTSRIDQIRAADMGVELRCDQSRWHAFDAVILANGIDALRFAEAGTLPLAATPGQIDHFPNAAPPPFAVAWGPYMAPAPRGGVVIGATHRDMDPADATRANLADIAAFDPDFARALDPREAAPRRAVRCQTPDRLPVAGPAPDFAYFGAQYDDLRTGIRRDYPAAQMIPGVHMLTGLGGRGLVTALLAARHVIAGITGEPSPLDVELAEALHPARFFIRDLRRAQRRRKG